MKIPYEQIADYMKGDCSPAKKKAVEEWIAEDSEHSRIFHVLQDEWKYVDTADFRPLPGRKQVWEKIESAINIKTKSKNHFRRNLFKYSSIAASVAVIVMTGFIYFNNERGCESVWFSVAESGGEKTFIPLPDSSKVWLRAGSTIGYHRERRCHVVDLQGEAFFEVAKHKERTFVVRSGALGIKVHGTSFNVRANTCDPEITVSLVEGSVSLVDNRRRVVLAQLTPNHKAVVSSIDMSYRIEPESSELSRLWMQEKLEIYDNNIDELVEKLEYWYGIDISIENPNHANRYTFVVTNETLKELLDLLDGVTPLAYEIDGKHVTARLK